MKLKKISSKYLNSGYVNDFVVSIVAGVSAFFWAFFFMSELSMLDLRVKTRNYINSTVLTDQAEQDDRIAVVYLSEETLKNLQDERSTKSDITSRKYLASIVDFIAQGKPAVIGLDYFLEDRDPDEGSDNRFINVIKSANLSGVPVVGGYMLKPKLTTSGAGVNSKRKYFDAVKTRNFLRYDEEGVLASTGFLNLWQQRTLLQNEQAVPYIRYYYPTFEQSQAFPLAIVNEYMKITGRILPSADLNTQLYINYRHSNPENLITVYDSSGIEGLLSAPPALKSLFQQKFKDKIVIIGNAMSGEDMHYVPVNDRSGIFGVLIQATIVKNYLDDDFIIQLSAVWRWLIILVTLIITVLAAVRLEPKKLFIFFAAYIAGFTALTFMTLYFWSLWIPVMSVITTQLVTILAIVLARIAISEKDNLDASLYLAEQIPESIISKLSDKIDESVLTPFKDDVYVLAGWAKNLPYSDKYKVTEIKRFIDEYHNSIKNVVFENGGCFNILPQNGFLAFWPSGFYQDNQFEQVLATAETIRALVESFNYRAKKMFGADEPIYIDIVILEDTGYIGNFSSADNRLFTVVSDSMNGVLQIPWLFSSDKKNSIILYDDIVRRLPPDRDFVKLDRTICDKDIFQLE